ncbi:hypothetical protein G4G28_21260 [Massilia sp. Dwa41.01b]|uniref:hypothetical protein n=1 Tax=unclassified Massilia TaxID=2609279 RepID=UPI001601B5F6|nr:MULTISPECIES: hypothetical protein [unclassified Massilia]QNA90394.1 hypothetical protein G4G28_21260 [Massilia sp. Dwa41.01b]QNA97622.1 hypothetical protein G4G31_00345 [Massilia sp. Se16.2.3]
MDRLYSRTAALLGRNFFRSLRFPEILALTAFRFRTPESPEARRNKVIDHLTGVRRWLWQLSRFALGGACRYNIPVLSFFSYCGACHAPVSQAAGHGGVRLFKVEHGCSLQNDFQSL